MGYAVTLVDALENVGMTFLSCTKPEGFAYSWVQAESVEALPRAINKLERVSCLRLEVYRVEPERTRVMSDARFWYRCFGETVLPCSG